MDEVGRWRGPCPSSDKTAPADVSCSRLRPSRLTMGGQVTVCGFCSPGRWRPRT